MFTDNVVLKTSVPGIEYCEETGKDRCFVFLRKLSKKKKNGIQTLGMAWRLLSGGEVDI